MFPFPFSFVAPAASGIGTVDNVYSMEFDGVDDYINITDLPALNAATELTFSCWVKKATGNILGIEAFKTSTNKVILYWWSDNNVYWGVRNTGTPTAASSALADFSNWHHLAGTYKGSTGAIELYIDGSSVNTQTGAPAATTDLSADFVIGKSNGTSFGEGNIDEVAIFNYALDSDQVQEIYDATSTGVTADLDTLSTPPVAWYRMGD